MLCAQGGRPELLGAEGGVCRNFCGLKGGYDGTFADYGKGMPEFLRDLGGGMPGLSRAHGGLCRNYCALKGG